MQPLLINPVRPMLTAWVVFLCACPGCSGEDPATNGNPAPPAKQRITIVCTTTILHEIAEVLAHDLADVRGLMLTGDNPHTYAPRPADVQTIGEADVILMNGLRLEPSLEPLIAEHAKDATIVRLGEASGLKHLAQADTTIDPHVWMSVPNYEAMVRAAADALAKEAPTHGAEIHKRLEVYCSQIQELNTWVRGQAQSLPRQARSVITSDDGLNYLADSLGVKNVHHAIDPTSQATEADRDALTEIVEREKPAALFIDVGESITWREIVTELAGKSQCTLAPPPQSHWLAEKEHATGTYPGMVRAAVEAIVQAVKAKPPA